ncbi:MAG TPA: response regulator transcription factor [Flavobacterium sp.]|nr:response regulator transcription factor [Flavobacterium sp.]
MAIQICTADNQPVVHCGLKSYFANHPEISISSQVYHFDDVREILRTRPTDILVIDLELAGLTTITALKATIKEFKARVVLFTNLAEHIYTPNAIKAGVAAYVPKTASLETLESILLRVNEGEIVFSDEIRRKLSLISRQNKSERLYRKLSTREIEVLRYLSEGKKNNEISRILGLNEKTISTYKLRLLTKLNVTNLVDLVNKAKTLDIV